jgi:hypothetical protein
MFGKAEQGNATIRDDGSKLETRIFLIRVQPCASVAKWHFFSLAASRL